MRFRGSGRGGRVGRSSVTVLVAVGALWFFVGAAQAGRPATAAEVRAVLTASGFAPDSAGFTTGCVRPTVRVSGSYAFATFRFRNGAACVRYAFNGSNGLRLIGRSWKQIFVGSEIPSCSIGLPADLTPCQPLTALAREIALRYQRAVLSGDAATACDFLSPKGLAALRTQLEQPGGAGCAAVMRVWAGEPNHGLPDDIAKVRVLSEQIGPATAVIVVGGLHSLSPVTLRLQSSPAVGSSMHRRPDR